MADNLPSFGWGGTGRVSTDESVTSALFDQSLPFVETLGVSAKSGILKSLGLGTAIRDVQLPAEAPTTPGNVLDRPGQDTPFVVEQPGYVNERLGGAGGGMDPYLATRPETSDELTARRQAAGAIDEETYKASPYFRTDIPWSPVMTEARAKAQAEIRDNQKAREFFMEKRPITSFIGQFAGGALDPSNYIPVAGPAVRAAAIARAGRTLGTAGVMAGEAALSQGALGLATMGDRQQFGDDVSWQAQVTDIAMGALTGGLIGGVAGRVGGLLEGRAGSLKNQMKARAVLDDAVGTLARDGEVGLTPTSAGFADEVAREVRPLQSFDDFMQLVESRRKAALPLDTVAREAGLRDTTAALPEVTTARFTPLSDLNIRDPEAIARAENVETFSAFDGLVGKRDELRDQIAQLNRARAPEADQARAEIDTIDADFNRTTPDQWPALEARKADAETRLAALERQGDTGPLAEARAALQDVDFQLRDIAPKIGQALEAGRQKFRENGISPDVLRVLRDFDMQGGVRFRDRPPPLSDWTVPVAPADPARIQQASKAEATVAKPETPDGFAKDVGFDPVTGGSAVSPLVRQIEAEGRLTPEDVAAIKMADDGIADADAFAKALEVATGCVI